MAGSSRTVLTSSVSKIHRTQVRLPNHVASLAVCDSVGACCRQHLIRAPVAYDNISENDVAKSSFNIFAVRRAFAYGHSLLVAKVRSKSSFSCETGFDTPLYHNVLPFLPS